MTPTRLPASWQNLRAASTLSDTLWLLVSGLSSDWLTFSAYEKDDDGVALNALLLCGSSEGC